MAGNAEMRILLLGKTGVGKSSSGNTILGMSTFQEKVTPCNSTTRCVAEETKINGKMIKVIDTPGFFGTNEVETENTDGADSPDDQKREMAESIVECSPGPHAVVIVLRVERYTKHEEETVELIKKNFTDEIFKYAVVLFTHGYDLKGETIEQFVKKSDKLHKFIEKCGGRCHVIDNEHWKSEQSGYKSNTTQVGRLLNTIEKLVEENGGNCYTNGFLQAVDTAVQNKMESIKKEDKGNLPEKEIREEAKKKVCSKIIAAGCATGVLLGALLGIPVLVGAAVYHGGRSLKQLLLILSGPKRSKEARAADIEEIINKVPEAAVAVVLAGAAGVGRVTLGAGAGAAGAGAGAEGAMGAGATVEAMVGAAGAVDVGVVAGLAAGVVGGVMIAAGAVAGGVTGAKAAEEADSPGEAAVMATGAVIDGVKKLF